MEKKCTKIFLYLGLFLIIAFFALPKASYAATSVTQYGITWTFDGDYEVGQFANGDYWVLGPVTINTITPTFTIDGSGNKVHGSMVNPSPLLGGDTGYGIIQYHTYQPSLNIEESLPYVAASGTSIVSVISYTDVDPRPSNSWVKSASILTVLPNVPPIGSFRPPYAGTDKTIEFNESNLDYGVLKNLPHVADTPTFSIVAGYFQKPWIDHMPGHRAQRAHPDTNMPGYGANIHDVTNIGALILNMDGTNEEKRDLFVYYTQLGIDNYRLVGLSKSMFSADGGHAGGRKLPIIVAGFALNNNELKNVGAKSGDYLDSIGYGPGNPPLDHIHFGEDDQTHYVTQLDVDITNGNHPTIPWRPSGIALDDAIWLIEDPGSPYELSDIGMPEYGIRHGNNPGWNTKQWNTYKSYRGIADRPFCATALAILIMGLEEEWNHNVLIDYADRRVEMGSISGGWRQKNYQINMWDTYRADYHNQPNLRADVDGSSGITTTDALLTLRNSLGLSMNGTAWQVSATTGDVNCDGVSNSTDALLILRHSLGLSMSGTGWCGDING